MCEAANTDVKVHESVLRRLRLRTANYAPTLLPNTFKVVDNLGHSTSSPPVHGEHWQLFHKRITSWIGVRKWLYGILLELTLGVVGISYYFWSRNEQTDLTAESSNDVADILYYITPKFFDQLIHRTVVVDQEWFIGATIVFSVFIALRMWAFQKTTRYAERLRKLIIRSPEGHPDYPTSGSPGDSTTPSDTKTEPPQKETTQEEIV